MAALRLGCRPSLCSFGAISCGTLPQSWGGGRLAAQAVGHSPIGGCG